MIIFSLIYMIYLWKLNETDGVLCDNAIIYIYATGFYIYKLLYFVTNFVTTSFVFHHELKSDLLFQHIHDLRVDAIGKFSSIMEQFDMMYNKSLKKYIFSICFQRAVYEWNLSKFRRVYRAAMIFTKNCLLIRMYFVFEKWREIWY